MIKWEIKGREFGNCNCDYGCPCQFNALPTHGHCGGLRHDAARRAEMRRHLPLGVHEGKGEGLHIIDRRATPEQREALLRILRGEDTEPGATVYQVFASTCDTFHDPIVADIDFELDIDGRRARAKVEGFVEMHGEPILNPITGAEHRVRIVQPNGFEFAEAEIGRGWAKITAPISFTLEDTYGQFARIHLCQSGMVRGAHAQDSHRGDVGA